MTTTGRLSGWGTLAAAAVLGLGASLAVPAAERPSGLTDRNSLGMDLVRVEAGTFRMGISRARIPSELREGRRYAMYGDFDERPVHPVTISRPFYMGAFEVTNAQYEQFDPSHRARRGELGFSREDDEAVVFVSWHDAVAFCRWLSEKEGLPYRLPTEAEWEYAARAGTTTYFHTGDRLPGAYLPNPAESWYPALRWGGALRERPPWISLRVGQTPPNSWGLHAVHGNVEEWVHDWYGPYEPGPQVDPVGRVDGDFRVTRGGSHSTFAYYLRSGNRAGTLPDDRTWVIGFRIVLGEMPETEPLSLPAPPPHQQDVSQQAADYSKGPNPAKPHFHGPRRYVKIAPDSYGPAFSTHNHDPALVEFPNGDLLAIWYSTEREPGRELTLLASRLRYGADEWEPASLFWDAPDRNDHAPALWADGKGRIFHFVGLSTAATWGNLALIMRTSTDSGATWSKAKLIAPDHGGRRMPIESVIRTRDGAILLPSDAPNPRPGGMMNGTSIWLSDDDGETWTDPGGTIAGIHAGVVQLKDGRLMALGRGDDIDGRMPRSLSSDMGKSWSYSASPLPPVTSGQRLALIRLKEGPLFLASFTDVRSIPGAGESEPMTIEDANGEKRPVRGLYAALSYNEGETWPVRRLITDDGPGRWLVGGAWTGRFRMSRDTAEPRGYLSVTQTPDGVIHLISSALHYELNLAWVEAKMPGR